MSEMDKLEHYLKEKGIPYLRADWLMKAYGHDDGEQIIVYDNDGDRAWDVVCGHGTYGREQGLLEAMGSAVVRGSDSVEGWLTAEDIIKRLEGKE